MVKALQAISVTAIVSAGLLIASITCPGSLFRLGTGGHEQTEHLPRSVLNGYRQQRAASAHDQQKLASPLVKEAQRLASLLNRATPTAKRDDNDDDTPDPPPVKFALMGTSCSLHSKDSFACIRFADNAWQWVRLGERIDRGVIQEIDNGSITYWNGRRNVDMIVERAPGAATSLEGGSLQ